MKRERKPAAWVVEDIRAGLDQFRSITDEERDALNWVHTATPADLVAVDSFEAKVEAAERALDMWARLVAWAHRREKRGKPAYQYCRNCAMYGVATVADFSRNGLCRKCYEDPELPGRAVVLYRDANPEAIIRPGTWVPLPEPDHYRCLASATQHLRLDVRRTIPTATANPNMPSDVFGRRSELRHRDPFPKVDVSASVRRCFPDFPWRETPIKLQDEPATFQAWCGFNFYAFDIDQLSNKPSHDFELLGTDDGWARNVFRVAHRIFRKRLGGRWNDDRRSFASGHYRITFGDLVAAGLVGLHHRSPWGDAPFEDPGDLDEDALKSAVTNWLGAGIEHEISTYIREVVGDYNGDRANIDLLAMSNAVSLQRPDAVLFEFRDINGLTVQRPRRQTAERHAPGKADYSKPRPGPRELLTRTSSKVPTTWPRPTNWLQPPSEPTVVVDESTLWLTPGPVTPRRWTRRPKLRLIWTGSELAGIYPRAEIPSSRPWVDAPDPLYGGKPLGDVCDHELPATREVRGKKFSDWCATCLRRDVEDHEHGPKGQLLDMHPWWLTGGARNDGSGRWADGRGYQPE
jgi:hypothetical protein